MSRYYMQGFLQGEEVKEISLFQLITFMKGYYPSNLQADVQNLLCFCSCLLDKTYNYYFESCVKKKFQK